MNKKNQKNIWELNNIPALEFCTLPRAAELLSCKNEDLIHFANIGAIELSIKLYKFEVYLTAPFEFIKPEQWEERFKPKLHPCHHNSPLSLFMPKVDLDYHGQSAEMYRYYYQNPDKPALKRPLMYLFGLWSLVILPGEVSFFSKMAQGIDVSLSALDFGLKECDIPFTSHSENEIIFTSPINSQLYQSKHLDHSLINPIITLTINDMYLTRNQVEKIYFGVGNQLPNYINGKVAIPAPDEEKEERVNNGKIGEFIELLIQCVPELGDEVIKANANKRHSMLSRFIERKHKEGKFMDIKMPSSATIEKYFKI